VRDAVQKRPTMVTERRRQEGDILPFVGHLMRLPDFDFGLEFELEEKTNGKLTQGMGIGVRNSYVHRCNCKLTQRTTKELDIKDARNGQQKADATEDDIMVLTIHIVEDLIMVELNKDLLRYGLNNKCSKQRSYILFIGSLNFLIW